MSIKTRFEGAAKTGLTAGIVGVATPLVVVYGAMLGMSAAHDAVCGEPEQTQGTLKELEICREFFERAGAKFRYHVYQMRHGANPIEPSDINPLQVA